MIRMIWNTNSSKKRMLLLISAFLIVACTACNSTNSVTDSNASHSAIAPSASPLAADQTLDSVLSMQAPSGIGQHGFYNGAIHNEAAQLTWDNRCVNQPVDACDDFVGTFQFTKDLSTVYELHQLADGTLREFQQSAGDLQETAKWQLQFDMEFIRGERTLLDGQKQEVAFKVVEGGRSQRSMSIIGSWMTGSANEEGRQRLFIRNPSEEGFEYEAYFMNGTVPAQITGLAKWADINTAVSTFSEEMTLTIREVSPGTLELSGTGILFGANGNYEQTRIRKTTN